MIIKKKNHDHILGTHMGQLICLAFLFLIGAGMTQANEYPGDIRELCRVEVAGTLIRLKNQADMLQQNVYMWNQKVVQLEREVKRLSKLKSPLLARAEVERYDIQLEEEIAGIVNKIDIIDNQLKLGKEELDRNTPALARADRELADFRSGMKPIFKVTKTKVEQKGAYNFSVNYHHKCGAYQYLCPLPETQRKQLQALTKSLTEKTHCQRYAQVLPPLPEE